MTVPIDETEEVITFDWHSVQEVWPTPSSALDSGVTDEAATLVAGLATSDVAGSSDATSIDTVPPSGVEVVGVAEGTPQVDITSEDTASTVESVPESTQSLVTSDEASCVDYGDEDRLAGHLPPYNVAGTRTLAENTFDGGTSGHDIAVINSGSFSGTPFTTVYRGAGSTLKFDSAQSWKGGQSLRIATDATAPSCFAEWDETIIGVQEEIFVRFYMRFASVPPVGESVSLVQLYDTESTSESNIFLSNVNAGTAIISIFHWWPDGGFNGVGFVRALSADTWYRVEARFRFSPDEYGVTEYWVFHGDDNWDRNTPFGLSEWIGGHDIEPNSSVRRINRVRLGAIHYDDWRGPNNAPNIWIDNFAVSNVGWIGIATTPIADRDFATAEDYAAIIQKSGTDTASCVDTGASAELYWGSDTASAVDTQVVTGITTVVAEDEVLVDDFGVYEDA